jgi:hypothetical protein
VGIEDCGEERSWTLEMAHVKAEIRCSPLNEPGSHHNSAISALAPYEMEKANGHAACVRIVLVGTHASIPCSKLK